MSKSFVLSILCDQLGKIMSTPKKRFKNQQSFESGPWQKRLRASAINQYINGLTIKFHE